MFKVTLLLLTALSNLPSIAPQYVAEYGQCGGIGYTGSTQCCPPFTCQVLNSYYSQCSPQTSTTSPPTCSGFYTQCGGIGWSGLPCCICSTCVASSPYYSQCVPTSSSSSSTLASTSTTKPSTSTSKASTSTTKPSTSTSKASTSTTKPSTSTTKPSTSTSKASTSTTKPSTSTSKASTSTTKPSTSTTKPSTSTSKASTSTTKPSTSTSKASTSTTKPSTSTSKASTSTTKPSTSTTKASTSTTKPSTSTTKASTSTTNPSTSTTQASGGCSAQYAQCGGINWSGLTTCCSGYTCQYLNPYYYQCLVPTGSSTSSSSTVQASGSSSSTAASSSTSFISNGGTAGITTRYWDCCKVSCSWRDKATVTSPVESCAAGGVASVDPNTASGCNGGTSYTCSNQQPWNVSSTLSYGYAAVNLAGQGESNWCCACYSLIFTSGPVIGKELIVQVTNTGYDLAGNQFDLQMPGGGFGIFNGCASQFPQTSASSWGANYGGVSQRSDCSNLPSVLQSGCFWRFDWFMDANNPTMTFTQVTCPAVLTANTQCIRN